MEAIGPVLLLFSLPFIFRLVPPNRFFGFRIPATLRDRSVWYDANAMIARHLFVLGVLLVSPSGPGKIVERAEPEFSELDLDQLAGGLMTGAL